MKKKIIGFPHQKGFGGPGSFQMRFEKELVERGYEIVYYENRIRPDVIFIVGGTKKIFWLLKNKFSGVPVIYRLDGINWLHRKKAANRSFKTFLISESINIISKIIHAVIADFIIYQSNFVKKWWDRSGFIIRKRFEIVLNGVDLNIFKPSKIMSNDVVRVICLEGNLDYSPYAIDLINSLQEKLKIPFEVYGDIKFSSERKKLSPNVDYRGIVHQKDLPSIYVNSIYFSLDVNAACPNTVVEALACGAPVVGFDTGALSELVENNNAGIIVPYGKDPWSLGYPDEDALLKAIYKVYDDFESYSKNARLSAERKLGVKEMTDKYLTIINRYI